MTCWPRWTASSGARSRRSADGSVRAVREAAVLVEVLRVHRIGNGLSRADSAPSSCTLKSARSRMSPGSARRNRCSSARTRAGSAPAARSAASWISTRTGSCAAASSAERPSSFNAARATGSSSRLRASAQARSRYFGHRPSARKSSGTRPSPRCMRMLRNTFASVPLASSGTSSMGSMSCGTPRGTRCSPRGPRATPPTPPESASASTQTAISSFAST